MDNLLSNCGLVDAKIRASDIDLPVLSAYVPAIYMEVCAVIPNVPNVSDYY